MDACKLVKGLEPKFGHFMTKAAVMPEVVVQEVQEELKARKEVKKEVKKSAGLTPGELKERRARKAS